MALSALVSRGTITSEQRALILAEVAGGPAPPAPGSERPRSRALSEVLIEVGLYVGSALVLAAALALVAQAWPDLSRLSQIAVLGSAALITGVVGSILARDAAPGSARRRLAGVMMTATAATAAGAVAVALGDRELTGVAALATALAIMVPARVRAASAITEIGLFAAAFALLNVIGQTWQPESAPVVDEFGNEVYAMSAYERLMSLGAVAFGLSWALVVARWLMHRVLGVALGVGVALMSAMPLAGEPSARIWGLAALATLAVVGFWRFMAEGLWPWLVGAIASVTAFVFWAVGVQRNPALAFLVAGLVLLASSGLGWQVARRRRARLGTTDPAG